MKSKLVLGGLFLSVFQTFMISNAHSSEILLNQDDLLETDRRSRVNPYRLRLGPVSKEIFSFELGNMKTPFFKDQDSGNFKRRYKNNDKCFEVSFLDTVSVAKKICCSKLLSDLKLPGLPEYVPARVQDLANTGLSGFVFQAKKVEYMLKAYLHTSDTIQMDRRILGRGTQLPHPTQDFSLSVSSDGAVSLDAKNGLSIQQSSSVKMGKIGIQDEQSNLFTSKIIAEPSAIVFHDGMGSVILVNRLLMPSIFQDHLLEDSQEATAYFEKLKLLSLKEPICYRDDWMNPSQFDCRVVVFERYKTYEKQSYRLLKVDFFNKAVTVLKK